MVIIPIVGVYIPIIRIPIKGGMTIPNIATFDHGTGEPQPPMSHRSKDGNFIVTSGHVEEGRLSDSPVHKIVQARLPSVLGERICAIKTNLKASTS